MIILGLNYGHDSSAALIIDGKIIANVQEERFTRIKHDSSFPSNSIQFCLEIAKINSTDIDYISIPFQSGHPQLRHYFEFNSQQLKDSFSENIVKGTVRKKIIKNNISLPIFIEKIKLKESCKVICVNHHLSHAASAYFTSGRTEKTLVFAIDGLGDGDSVSIYKAEGLDIKKLKSFGRNGSIGWFYSNVTEALGWAHGDGEGTTMGLAPYGNDKDKKRFRGYYPEYKNGDLIKEHDFGDVFIYSKNESIQFHFEEVFQIKKIVDQIGKENSAACVQTILEEQIQEIIYPWIEKTGINNIACAGGVFLNVKMNQNLWYSGKLKTQHIYPDPGDAGLALGSALYTYSREESSPKFVKITDLYHGPEFSNDYIESLLKLRKLKYKKLENPSKAAAEKLAENKIIGWFQGRMEAGPRALGNRSILMSSNKAENKDIINAEVKFRQGFRPFCPSVLADKFHDYFENARDEEYMITSFAFKKNKRDKVPAVVHQDGTGRPQKVNENINKKYYDLIKYFGDLTGEYLVLNTSFNIKGEPMICHPKEAIRCFFDNGLDVLFLGNYLIEKD